MEISGEALGEQRIQNLRQKVDQNPTENRCNWNNSMKKVIDEVAQSQIYLVLWAKAK